MGYLSPALREPEALKGNRAGQHSLRINDQRRAITADTDLRLCRFFGLSNGYWLRAQVAHDTEVAQEALAADLDRIKPWPGTAA